MKVVKIWMLNFIIIEIIKDKNLRWVSSSNSMKFEKISKISTTRHNNVSVNKLMLINHLKKLKFIKYLK